jgi:hypothetical protein
MNVILYTTISYKNTSKPYSFLHDFHTGNLRSCKDGADVDRSSLMGGRMSKRGAANAGTAAGAETTRTASQSDKITVGIGIGALAFVLVVVAVTGKSNLPTTMSGVCKAVVVSEPRVSEMLLPHAIRLFCERFVVASPSSEQQQQPVHEQHPPHPLL